MQLAPPPNLARRLIPERLASPQLQALIRRRLAELGGVALAALAVAMLVALATYNPRDPSPDTSGAAQTGNLAGPVGAAYADLVLQYFGLAALLPALALLAWAWRIGSRGGLGSLTLRVVALICMLPVAAAVLGGAPLLLPQGMQALLPHTGWPGTAGPGGAIGVSLGQTAIEAGQSTLGAVGGVLVWLLALALGILLVPLSLGLSAGEWRAVGRGAGRTARYPLARARRGRALAPRPTLRPTLRQRLVRGARVAAGAGPAIPDEDDFDHVMPGESPFAQAAHQAAHQALGRAPADPAARSVRERREPSLRGTALRDPRASGGPIAEPGPRGRTQEIETPRPLLGSNGWVLPPGAPEEPEDLPALPLRSRTALRASRKAARELPPIQLGGPVEPAAPAPAPPEPAARGGMLSIARLLGGRDDAARAATPRPAAPRWQDETGTADGQWRLPPTSLLHPAPPRASVGPSPESLQANARLLETVLSDYGVQGAIGDIRAGPVVTLYELEPAPGIRSRARDRAGRRRGPLAVGHGGAHRHRAGPQRDRHRGAERAARDGLSLRAARADAWVEHPAQAVPGAGQGHLRRPGLCRPRPHAAPADRRHHRVGQVGRHQLDDPVAALPAEPGRVPADHDRPEDAGAVDL